MFEQMTNDGIGIFAVMDREVELNEKRWNIVPKRPPRDPPQLLE